MLTKVIIYAYTQRPDFRTVNRFRSATIAESERQEERDHAGQDLPELAHNLLKKAAMDRKQEMAVQG